MTLVHLSAIFFSVRISDFLINGVKHASSKCQFNESAHSHILLNLTAAVLSKIFSENATKAKANRLDFFVYGIEYLLL